MKLYRESGRKKGLPAKELLRPEPPQEDVGFDPETGIPPEVRKRFFTELDQLAQEGSWIEYIFLFNRLAELFPEQAKGAKRTIDTEEVARAWEERVKTRVGTTDRMVNLDWKRSHTSETRYAYLAAAELKLYGLPVDYLITVEEREKFSGLIQEALRHGYVKLTEVLAGLQLDLFTLKNIIKPDEAEDVWATTQRRLKTDRPDLLPESVALIKLLFPEKVTELAPESIPAARQKALDELKGFGDYSSADLFRNLDLATASEVFLNEQGELVKRKSNSRGLGKNSKLPERTVL